MHKSNMLTIRNLGIDTYRENIVFMRADCEVCRSEGFAALTRVIVRCGQTSIVATLYIIQSELLGHREAGLSIEAIRKLGAAEGDTLWVSHLNPIASFGFVRAKIYGQELSQQQMEEIIGDIANGRYSNIELAAFITATSGESLSTREIIGLTKAMVKSGSRLSWDDANVYDKHCVGGLPGNRTTPIVVGIAAAVGIKIPKTSSRAITSPAGTADTMEVMTNVMLTLKQMKQVVEKENGCLVWGGAVSLSPADDVLISVEKALDIDSEGQMVASVLSKKLAAGAGHVVIDIPVGQTAKVRSAAKALELVERFQTVGQEIGLAVRALVTDGSQPIGRGIGPSLEAMDVLSVLRNEADAPTDLRARAILVAGELLELAAKVAKGEGQRLAGEIIDSGLAYQKFKAICLAQGRFSEPSYAQFQQDILSPESGIVSQIDCRRIAKVAKLAGAPKSPRAGVFFKSPLGKSIDKGSVLLTVYSESQGELDYAVEYYQSQTQIISIT